MEKQTVVNEIVRTESVVSESAFLVGVFLATSRPRIGPAGRIGRSCRSRRHAGRGQAHQRRESPDAATYLGKGKVQELAALAHSEMANVIFFDNDLSPGQTRNLEKATG